MVRLILIDQMQICSYRLWCVGVLHFIYIVGFSIVQSPTQTMKRSARAPSDINDTVYPVKSFMDLSLELESTTLCLCY